MRDTAKVTINQL